MRNHCQHTRAFQHATGGRQPLQVVAPTAGDQRCSAQASGRRLRETPSLLAIILLRLPQTRIGRLLLLHPPKMSLVLCLVLFCLFDCVFGVQPRLHPPRSVVGLSRLSELLWLVRSEDAAGFPSPTGSSGTMSPSLPELVILSSVACANNVPASETAGTSGTIVLRRPILVAPFLPGRPRSLLVPPLPPMSCPVRRDACRDRRGVPRRIPMVRGSLVCLW
jgi:hypothetical protein